MEINRTLSCFRVVFSTGESILPKLAIHSFTRRSATCVRIWTKGSRCDFLEYAGLRFREDLETCPF